MLFDGNNAYVTASYAVYFVSIAAIIGAIFVQRKTTTRKITQLNTLLQGGGGVKASADMPPGDPAASGEQAQSLSKAKGAALEKPAEDQGAPIEGASSDKPAMRPGA